MSYLDESPLQAALRSGWTLQDLAARLGIKSKRHPRFPNLVLFVYDQIESPKLEPIVRSARGHILDEESSWDHVCRPFDRFLNWDEGVNQGIENPDIGKSVVFKKEDGSLLNMWFYRDEWHVSTKGSPDAGGNVGDNPFTFAELFWRVWGDKGLFVPDIADSVRTLSFELCTLHNRVVCSQPQERIILIGIRSNITGREFRPDLPYTDKIEVCKSYNLGNLDDIQSTFKELPAMEMEGYVVAHFLPDGRTIRAKVKHPGYLAIHHLKEGNSKKRLLELIRTGEEGEFLSYFPEYASQLDEIRRKFEALVKELENAWETNRDVVDQKEFALKIKALPMSGAIFWVRRMGGTIRGRLAEIPIDSLTAVIGLKEQAENETR
jgi:hypothetical protein